MYGGNTRAVKTGEKKNKNKTKKKKHIESMLYAVTQPELELLSNRYGSRTTQHMHNDQTTSVQLSHGSLRYTQVS